MSRSYTKFYAALVICAILLVALNAFWVHWHPHTSLGNSWLVKISSGSGRLHSLASAALHWQTLEKENSDLRAQLAAEISDKAQLAKLQKDNDRLNTALGLAAKTRKNAIPAGLYNISLTADGYTAMINQGTNEHVAAGQTVVGDNNILIGSVRNVYADSARVALVTDPTFKVTVEVLGGSAKGLARGLLDKGMALDLVIQSDQINQGDTLISSGDDMIPAGLVVGTVSRVEQSSAKLFKEVSVTPSAQFVSGNAYILQ